MQAQAQRTQWGACLSRIERRLYLEEFGKVSGIQDVRELPIHVQTVHSVFAKNPDYVADEPAELKTFKKKYVLF